MSRNVSKKNISVVFNLPSSFLLRPASIFNPFLDFRFVANKKTCPIYEQNQHPKPRRAHKHLNPRLISNICVRFFVSLCPTFLNFPLQCFNTTCVLTDWPSRPTEGSSPPVRVCIICHLCAMGLSLMDKACGKPTTPASLYLYGSYTHVYPSWVGPSLSNYLDCVLTTVTLSVAWTVLYGVAICFLCVWWWCKFVNPPVTFCSTSPCLWCNSTHSCSPYSHDWISFFALT